MKTNIYKYLVLKILPTKIKSYTATSSPNCQLLSTLFCPHPLHPLQICSTHSKFVPPTPNLLHPLQICSARSDVWLMFLQYKTKTHKSIIFLLNANKYPHQIFSTSTPLAHSPHPLRCSFSTSLHPLIYSIRQRRENAHETVSISASPSTVPVFIKFKFLYYAPHVYIMVCFKLWKENLLWEIWMGVFIVAIRTLHISSALTFLSSCSRITYHTDRHTHTHTHTETHTHTHTQYVYYYKNVSIILIFTYENKKYTRSSKLTM